tara:strand:- start:160 stop:690 length:531 start_codon:yes stop_codon:yes gene_type:complete
MNNSKTGRAGIVVLLGIALLVGLAFTATADVDRHDGTIEEVLADIRSRLGLDNGDRIIADQVPEDQLERLGDAVMSEIHPDADVHSWMDEMMGGEGSESLASAHRWMGYQYLADGSSDYTGSGRGRGMMGGMMGFGMMGGNAFLSPRDIAERRYAAGEITRDEYRQLLEDLSRSEQ